MQVRFPGGVTDPKRLVCGVPQGSPISPLLFLLYLAEPMCSGVERARFSYADDIGILGIGPTVAESASSAQREVDSLMDWAKENAVSFDTSKSEVIHFPGRKREEGVEIQINGSNIKPAEHIRWLGVHLDPKLSFKHHVTTWCGKALKAAQHIRRLNSVRRGAAPSALVTVVDMCVVPVATFGADVWWPGRTRPTANGTSAPHATFLCNLIDKAVLLALRAALPVWKTTPNAVIHREGGIPPARILLEANRLRVAARLNSLDDRHPLRSRATICPNMGTLKYKKTRKFSKRPEIQMSRLQRAYQQLPPAEAALPLSAPKYNKADGTKLEGAKVHLEWIRSISPTDICAYSDGSSEGHRRSSWGYVLQRNGKTFEKGQGILHGGEVYDAEITGAIMALQAAIPASRTGEKVFVLLDNQAAVNSLRTGKSSSSLSKTQKFYDIACKVNAKVRWVPGHSKITGNEEADAAARAALKLLPPRHAQPEYISLAYQRRYMHDLQQKLVDDWWLNTRPARYCNLDLLMRRRKPPELAMPRRLLHRLIAARTGHGDFASHHRRFKHADACMNCACGLETSPTCHRLEA